MILFMILIMGLMLATVTAGGNTWAGGGYGAPLRNAGVPSAGTSGVQTLTFDADGGTFKLGFDGYTTAAISWSATNNTLRDNVDAALEALPSIGTGNVTTAVGTMTAGVGTLTVTFAGALGKKAVAVLTVEDNSLTGTGTLTVDETTPGVDATKRGAPKGAKLLDITNGVDYVNTGTEQAPTWTKVGTQS